jgi:hypothetical protein
MQQAFCHPVRGSRHARLLRKAKPKSQFHLEILMLTFAIAVAGALIGISSIKTHQLLPMTVLPLAHFYALLLAALFGALASLLPPNLAVWAARVALLCVAFLVGTLIAQRG